MTATFLFAMAMVLAAIEIEAEGKYGWAERMPTWYRTTGAIAKIYGRLMGGKPLTGYHTFMFFFPVMIFHYPFFAGTAWTLEAELKTFAIFFVWSALWDFLWFVLNPTYTIHRFSKSHVWWHAKSVWVFGRFPIDYLNAVAISYLLVGGIAYLNHTAEPLIEHTVMLGIMGWWLATTIAGAPLYHRWYENMRARDDREQSPIFHKEDN